MSSTLIRVCFLFNDTAPTEIYSYGHSLSLHDALPIWRTAANLNSGNQAQGVSSDLIARLRGYNTTVSFTLAVPATPVSSLDRKSPRLNSSHYCATRMPSSA